MGGSESIQLESGGTITIGPDSYGLKVTIKYFNEGGWFRYQIYSNRSLSVFDRDHHSADERKSRGGLTKLRLGETRQQTSMTIDLLYHPPE